MGWKVTGVATHQSSPEQIPAQVPNARRCGGCSGASRQEAADHEEKENVQEDTGNRCQNPFCGNALSNTYVSYCKERTWQRYRAVKLQCLANANAAAVGDIETNGRRDFFLVLGATGTADNEKEKAEAEEPFVIPRRKRSRTDATVQNGDQSGDQSSNRELPLIRPRMNFNEVLAHFEPRAAQVPALAVSSQMKARRVQQASRWTQSRREFKVAPMPRSPQTQPFAGGGHYGRSRNWSMRSGLPTPRAPYRPRLSPYRPTPRETANSGVGRRRKFYPRPQEARSNERSSRPQYFSMGANPHVREPPGGSRPSSEYFAPEQSQWLSSGPQVDRRREVTGNPYDGGERFVHRPQESNRVIVDVGQERNSRSFPRDTAFCRDEPDRNHVELAPEPFPPARLPPPPPPPPETPMEQIVSSDTDMDCEASFSVHDSFLSPLLSKFIVDLPSQLEAVLNSTKRPRKLRWYLEYTQRIERICSPHVHIQMESKSVVVLVENRVWLKLKGPSTVILLEKTITTMRDHAISWRELKSDVKQSLDLYRSRRGDAVDMGSVFMRAWNYAKDSPRGTFLPRGVNYFCGSRLHHWSFVLGKVEIGSGSHDEKREAFRLAAANAADFLLGLNDGQNDHTWRPPRVQRVNPSEDDSDCELLYVKDPADEAAAAAATASAFELSSSSKSSSADVSDNEALPKTEGDGTGETTVIVISDSEEKDIPELIDPTSANSLASQAAVDTVASATEVAPTDQCSMCEVIRMRKPDSAGCRQCQLANKQTRSNRKTNCSEAEVATTNIREEIGVRPDSSNSNSPRVGQLPKSSNDSSRNAQTESVSRPAKRLRSFFESIRMTE